MDVVRALGRVWVVPGMGRNAGRFGADWWLVCRHAGTLAE